MIKLLPNNQNILIYDSHCKLCQWLIRFLKRYERRTSFTYVSNNSQEAQGLANDYGLDLDSLNSVILISNGRVYTKSTAALRVTIYLKGGWPLLSLLLVFPRPLRDYVYGVIARNRYRWFGRCESCSI